MSTNAPADFDEETPEEAKALDAAAEAVASEASAQTIYDAWDAADRSFAERYKPGKPAVAVTESVTQNDRWANYP